MGIGLGKSPDNRTPEEETIHFGPASFPEGSCMLWFVHHHVDAPCERFGVDIHFDTIYQCVNVLR